MQVECRVKNTFQNTGGDWMQHTTVLKEWPRLDLESVSLLPRVGIMRRGKVSKVAVTTLRLEMFRVLKRFLSLSYFTSSHWLHLAFMKSLEYLSKIIAYLFVRLAASLTSMQSDFQCNWKHLN